MPRLENRMWEIADADRFNTYDCLFLRGGDDPFVPAPFKRLSLFGEQNLGHPLRTNLQRPRLLIVNDQTTYIQNWYARTTFKIHELNAWANTATARLWMGSWIMAEISVADLLNRREGERSEIVHPSAMENRLGVAAMEIHMELEQQHRSWRDLSDDERARYRKAAVLANRHYMLGPQVIIVPVRQYVHVEIELHDSAAFDRMIEQCDLACDIPPVGLWFHIEGFKRRDAC